MLLGSCPGFSPVPFPKKEDWLCSGIDSSLISSIKLAEKPVPAPVLEQGMITEKSFSFSIENYFRNSELSQSAHGILAD